MCYAYYYENANCCDESAEALINVCHTCVTKMWTLSRINLCAGGCHGLRQQQRAPLHAAHPLAGQTGALGVKRERGREGEEIGPGDWRMTGGAGVNNRLFAALCRPGGRLFLHLIMVNAFLHIPTHPPYLDTNLRPPAGVSHGDRRHPSGPILLRLHSGCAFMPPAPPTLPHTA